MQHEQIKQTERLIRGEYTGITGIVARRDGNTLLESYFNGRSADNAQHVFSVTKSVINALFGIAMDKGYIKSVNQRVLDFFPSYAIPGGEEVIQSITIKDLLTMTAPYKYDTEPYEEFFVSENWMQFALNLLGGKEKTGAFRYAALVGSHILSGILSEAIGGSILGFADEHLFRPLGINVPGNVVLSADEFNNVMTDKNTKGWCVDPQGINTAGWGLFLKPMDMARFGELYLNNGVYNGARLISSSWIEESTVTHSRLGERLYGYLWWIINDKERVYAALGDGGNVVYVNPNKRLVVAVAGFMAPNQKDSPENSLELILKHIEPLIAD